MSNDLTTSEAIKVLATVRAWLIGGVPPEWRMCDDENANIANYIDCQLETMCNAVTAERERCAQVAESFIPSGFPGGIGVARDDRARTIATAIRELK